MLAMRAFDGFASLGARGVQQREAGAPGGTGDGIRGVRMAVEQRLPAILASEALEDALGGDGGAEGERASR